MSQVITKPGVYGDISLSRYHEQCCDAPSISSSGLRTIEQKSPAHFFQTWSGNPDYEPEASDALSFGSAAHALLLGDEAFSERHIVRPFKDLRTKEAKEWVADQLEAGKVVVTQAQMERIYGMVDVLAAHPLKDELIGAGQVEQSVLWKEGDVWVKSRMDMRPLGDTLCDLKTTADAHPDACRRSITNYRYDMQFALGARGLLVTEGQHIGCHLILFQEKTPPYAITPVEIDETAIAWATKQNERAIGIFQECVRTGDWPGYSMPRPWHLPEWMEKRLTDEEKQGLLPDGHYEQAVAREPAPLAAE